MNGIKPAFMEESVLPEGYYDTAGPYKNPMEGNVNLLELSRYAKQVGKKLVELTKEEVERFIVKSVS